MKNEKAKKMAAIGASTIMAISGLSSLTYLGIKAYSKEELKHVKSHEQILKDAKSFNADLSVISRNANDNFHKLKINDNEPVIVTYQDYMDNEQVSMITNIIDYYNKVFSSINENYSFKLVKKSEARYGIDDTVISIDNADLSNGYLGNAIRPTILKKEGDVYFNRARILLDWEEISRECPEQKEYVVIHEFTHCLGIKDVYVEEYGMYNGTTIMNPQNHKGINWLYPNDYAVLQAMYSNEYEKHDNYDDTVSIVNEKIDAYNEMFYNEFSKKIINKTEDFVPLKGDEIIEHFGNRNINGESDYVEIKVENNKFYFLMKNFAGQIKEQASGDIVVYDGVMYVNNLQLNNVYNYTLNNAGASKKGNIMIAVYQDENGVSFYENSSRVDYRGYLLANEHTVDKKNIR